MSLSKVRDLLLTGAVFLILILYFFHPINDLVGDLGFYLKGGEIILRTHSVFQTNLFSYTNPNFPYLNINWLSELVFYSIFKTLSFNGLLLTTVFISFLTFLIVFFTSQKKYGLPATLITSLLFLQILFERTDVKPEVFSYFFVSLFLFILFKFKDRHSNLIYFLIPLETLWVNFHIYFFVGLALISIFIIDEIIEAKNFKLSTRLKTLLTVFIGSLVSTLINPNFLKGTLYPLFVLNNYGFKVEENIDFLTAFNSYNDTTFLYFGLSLVILFIGLIFFYKKLKPIDFILSIIFSAFALFAVRCFPLFALGVFIPFAKIANETISRTCSYFKKDKKTLISYGVVLMGFLLVIPTIIFNVGIHGVGFGVIDNSDAAINFIHDHSLSGPMYNNYDIGNYLIYRLYPKIPVFVDGRPEAYPKSFFEKTYYPMQLNPKVFDEVSKKYDFNFIVIEYTDTSPETIENLKQLIKSNTWSMVFLNSSTVIFLKNNISNQMLMGRYEINEKNFKVSKSDLNSKDSVRRYVNFFRTIGWDDSWLAMNLRYLDFEPNNCPALQNVAYIMQEKNLPTAQIYINKFISICSRTY
ncbi:MAG TPA: hypothetical protein VG965_00560 [Patescibacteria group bacterium]|nr:hypothetical protein [Patescibacteria group bacterium]